MCQEKKNDNLRLKNKTIMKYQKWYNFWMMHQVNLLNLEEKMGWNKWSCNWYT